MIQGQFGNIEKMTFICLTAGFLLAVVAGTLLHETGHYLAAKWLEYDAGIHFKSTVYHFNRAGRLPSAGEMFIITCAGPLQTMLTGGLGLFLLCRFCDSSTKTCPLSIRQWIFIFLSFFWLRQTINFLLGWGGVIRTGHYSYPGDEVKISRYLDMPAWLIPFLTGLAGAIIVGYVWMRFVPPQQRLSLLAAGIIGGMASYWLWFEWLGQRVLP